MICFSCVFSYAGSDLNERSRGIGIWFKMRCKCMASCSWGGMAMGTSGIVFIS